jgi:hypothetical protein
MDDKEVVEPVASRYTDSATATPLMLFRERISFVCNNTRFQDHEVGGTYKSPGRLIVKIVWNDESVEDG